MGIVHAGIHALSGLGRVRVASITSDENAFVDGKLGRDSLTNYILQLGKNASQLRDEGWRTDIHRPPIDLPGGDCVGFDSLLGRLRNNIE